MTDSQVEELSIRATINDLIQGWMFRDLGQWDKLRKTFHPDGTIAVTWFEGKFTDFVDASERQSKGDARSKHMIGTPILERNKNRVIAETNAIILVENVKLHLGCQAHSRLYDLVERRDGVWKIARRYCLYDMSNFTFPEGVVEIDKNVVAKFPREYAALGYLLVNSGATVDRVFPTRGSDQEKAIRAESEKWLHAV